MTTPKSRSFSAAIFAVLSAFIGIRRRDASLADQGIKPVHVVVAGLFCVACVVVTLLFIVRFVISQAH
jgi:hypothetical protein